VPEAKRIGRGAFLILVVTGVLTLLLSLETWGSCPTTPCGGILMAISHYSGLDLGFGFITGLSGLFLAAIGIAGIRRIDASPFATAAVVFALLIVATAGAAVVWMFVIPGADKEFDWPPFIVFLVGVVGLVGLVAGLWLKRRSR
jgi:hypothetical protein